MDAESADRVVETIEPLGPENGYGFNHGIVGQRTDQTTSWTDFKNVVSRRQTVCLLLFLGGLCFCAGIAVYFATMHNVSLVFFNTNMFDLIPITRWLEVFLVFEVELFFTCCLLGRLYFMLQAMDQNSFGTS